ncbi:DNA polymerase III subunit epsilon, partial [Candidatus Palibaumannia cicadellinicola]
MSSKIIRQIFLDTETTGINQVDVPYKGHRIIEIGAVEVINRRVTGKYFHTYLKPERFIDQDAFKIHGINNEFLEDKPTFAQVTQVFLDFIYNSELIIHNAPFDIGFINNELKMINHKIDNINTICQITDSLLLAQKIF